MEILSKSRIITNCHEFVHKLFLCWCMNGEKNIHDKIRGH